MNVRPVHLLLPLLGVALALLLPFEKPKLPIQKKKGGAAATAIPGVGGMWSNANFVERPTARPSTVDEVAAFLSEDMGGAFRKLDAQGGDAQVAALSRALAARMVAAYDPKGNVVHVLPANAVAAAEAAGDKSLLGPNVLRLVLVRMAVIAVDRQILTGWKSALDAAETPDAVHCAGAVLEGHAQYETERIAKNWVNQQQDFGADTFAKLVALLTAPPPASGGNVELPGAVEEAKFAIVDGHEFMAAVAKRRLPGIKGVLVKPPTDRNLILKPLEFIAPTPSASQVPDRVRKEFGRLLQESDGWTVVAESAPATDAQAWMEPLEKGTWGAEMGAFRSGYRWVATGAASGSSRTVYLFEFRTGGMAESFVSLAKAAAEKAGARVEGGAGRDGGLVGFSATQEAGGAPEARQLTSEGVYVIGIKSADTATKTRKNRRDK
jgi:hypothetical protein